MSDATEPLRVRAYPLTPGPGPGPGRNSPVPAVGTLGVRKFADVVPLRGRGASGNAGTPAPLSRRGDAAPRNPKAPAGAVPSGAQGNRATPEDRAMLREESRQIAQIARAVGQAAFEALARTRPLHQLARWLDAESFEKMRLRVDLTQASVPAAQERHYRNAVVRRSRVCRVAEQTYEVALVIADQQRVRAAALRIEQRRGQWKVSALEIG